MSENIYLSIIIPSYNESSRVASTLEQIASYMENQEYTYEIIVVDDGSTDDTAFQARGKQNIFKKFTLLQNETNRGKGYSVKRGMLEAKGELKLFMDADHSVKINNIDVFIEEIKKGYQIVIGSIELPGSYKKDENEWYRLVLGRISKLLIRCIAVPGIYDTQRGFKLFTRNSAESVFSKQTIDRWGFDIEILAIARKHNLRIKELPVSWINSRSSSLRLGSYFSTFIELLRIKINLISKKYE